MILGLEFECSLSGMIALLSTFWWWKSTLDVYVASVLADVDAKRKNYGSKQMCSVCEGVI